jgi:hypothetical protein
MTKRDFKDLAKIVQDSLGPFVEWRSDIIKDLVQFCQIRNPAFNEQLFIEACGMDYDEYVERYK